MKARACSRVSKSIVAGCAVAAFNMAGIFDAVGADWREVNDSVSEQIAMIQPPIGSHNIEIDNQGKGEVHLEGYVESEAARQRVQQAAERAQGVSRVENHLAISSSTQPRRNDEIARMEEAFRRDVPHGRYNVSVVTDPNRVILRGTVDSQATRERIVSSASSVAKRTVSDQLVIQGMRSDAEIQESLRRALENEYPRLMRDLKVSVQNGVATVEGKLSSRRQVDEVLAAALNIDGVRDVRSEISINGRPYSRVSPEAAPE